jgi:hypothetical protein
MTYPDGIDALVNVNATDSLAAGGHAARHNSVNTALEELADVLTVPATNTLALVPDGATERFRIDSAGLITGAGTSLGAWTAYTPGTNCTVGNGTITGAYMRIGRTVHYRARFTLGSTSVIVSDATILPPFTSVAAQWVGSAYYRDVSLAAFYTAYTKNQFLGYENTFGFVSATQPFTWATGDEIYVSATYEIA